MGRWFAWALFVVAITAGSAGAAISPATPAATVTSDACPVTQPNGNHPPGHRGPGDHGNDWLWTNLFMWSPDAPEVIVPDDGRITPDGTIHNMKWAWYRFVHGALSVDGRRLDGPSAPLAAGIPEGYGDLGFQVTLLTFPSAGCWEITGRVDGHELTFVTLVVAPQRTLPATPAS
jgi:hypothetical protein